MAVSLAVVNFAQQNIKGLKDGGMMTEIIILGIWIIFLIICFGVIVLIEYINRPEAVKVPECPCEKLRKSKAENLGLLEYATNLYEENQAKSAEIVKALEDLIMADDATNSFALGQNNGLFLAIEIVT